MPNESGVATVIDGCIEDLQKVKKQWSHCVKRYVDIQIRLCKKSSEISEVKKTLGKVSKDKDNYMRNDSILRNCTVDKMLNWAVSNGKKDKLVRIIERDLRYKGLGENTFWDEQRSKEENADNISRGEYGKAAENVFNSILNEFKGKKYGKIGKERISGETDLVIDLMEAVLDSIIKEYVGLIDGKKEDRRRRVFGGIKGKDLEKYLLRKAGLNKSSDEKSFKVNSMLYNLDEKRKNIEEIKNSENINNLFNLFKQIKQGKEKIESPDIKDLSTISDAQECMDEIIGANVTLNTVQQSLGSIICKNLLNK